MSGAFLLAGLLHQASGDPEADLDRYRSVQARPDPSAAEAVVAVVVTDDRLGAVGGRLDGIPLSVVAGSGAGGLTALARRAGSLHVVSAETVLRDLGDLAGNAGRVVAAAAELGDDVAVFVDIPTGRGTVEAIEVVEAAGLLGRVALGAPRAPERLSLLIEADLPFKATGLGDDPFGEHGIAPLLLAVEALVDGAEPDEAEQLLAHPDRTRTVGALSAWDQATRDRVRRRVRAVDCADAAGTFHALAAAGLR